MVSRKAELRVVLIVRHKDHPALAEHLATVERGEMNRTLLRLLNAAIGEGTVADGADDSARFQALLERIERLEAALLRAGAASAPHPAAPTTAPPAVQMRQPRFAVPETVAPVARETQAAPVSVAPDSGTASIDSTGAGAKDGPPPELTEEQTATMRRMLSAFDASPDGVDSL